LKVLRTEILVSSGAFPASSEFRSIHDDISSSIEKVKWPPGSCDFSIRPVKMGNGVKPIKEHCMNHLRSCGWHIEHKMRIVASSTPGNVDAMKDVPGDCGFVLEWETGNISSSHRALNKIAVGMLDGCLAGGCLIVPSRFLYKFLTDRIGNYQELEPYFPLWRSLSSHVTNGVLMVVEIEHDSTSDEVPFIPKGTDGRALR